MLFIIDFGDQNLPYYLIKSENIFFETALKTCKKCININTAHIIDGGAGLDRKSQS
jgi:hypothetical protein